MEMIERIISILFEENGIGKVSGPIEPVSGGFMHRMYKASVGQEYYAVKHLNPEIMKRQEAEANFDKAEMIERLLEKNNIPVVAALCINGKKRLCVEGNYFYIFKWHDGSITDWDHISSRQCYEAGSILGKIHSIECDEEINEKPKLSAINWLAFIDKASSQNSEITSVLKKNLTLITYAENMMNKARLLLPDICCISDEDMDPKNIMWKDALPSVIDLECLDYGNPVSHVLQLSLQWSGITTCNLNLELAKSFFEGYLANYDNGYRDYEKVFGIEYTWVEWLEYNIVRALNESCDMDERSIGVSEVINTVNRIKYIHDREDDIRNMLKTIY